MMLRCLVLAFAILSAGCTRKEPPVPVNVGAKTSTEQRVVAEVVAQRLESHGLTVERKFDLGGTADCDSALRTGKIDVYVEYAGLALITVLRSPSAASVLSGGAPAALARVRAEYLPAGLVWTEPLGFDNPHALVVRGNASELSISEVAAAARGWRAGFSLDFQQRSEFYPAIKRVYGLQFGEVRAIDPSRQYKDLAEHGVDVVVGNVTDAGIARFSLRALVDDRHVLPSFQAVPVVRRAALQQHAGLEDALNSLADSLDTATMRRLNEAVENSGRAPADVAREFLASR